jgi:hypothetical protein
LRRFSVAASRAPDIVVLIRVLRIIALFFAAMVDGILWPPPVPVRCGAAAYGKAGCQGAIFTGTRFFFLSKIETAAEKCRLPGRTFQ